MTNPVFSDVNKIFQTSPNQSEEKALDIKTLDNTFTNIFDFKINNTQKTSENTEITDENEEDKNNLEDSLGVPIGLNIDGFDYENAKSTTTEDSSNNNTYPIKTVENFKENRITNLYKSMDKETILDLSDLISKI